MVVSSGYDASIGDAEVVNFDVILDLIHDCNLFIIVYYHACKAHNIDLKAFKLHRFVVCILFCKATEPKFGCAIPVLMTFA